MSQCFFFTFVPHLNVYWLFTYHYCTLDAVTNATTNAKRCKNSLNYNYNYRKDKYKQGRSQKKI